MMTVGFDGARALRSVLRVGSAMAVLSLVVTATPGAALAPLAITYNRSGLFQDVSYFYSITTNGTLGNLAASDITSFSFQASRPGFGGQSFDSSNGFLFYPSSSLSATASDLNYDFSSGNGTAFGSSTGPTGFCFDGGEGLCSGRTSKVVAAEGLTDVQPMSGVQSVASVGGPEAPAPLLGMGLIPALGSFAGLVATRLRRRKTVVA